MELTFAVHLSGNTKASGVTVTNYLYPFRELEQISLFFV